MAMDKLMHRTCGATLPAKTRRGFLRSALCGALAVAGAATAGTGPSGCGESLRLVAQRGEIFTPGAARVVLRGVHNDIVALDVFNQTGAPMVIYRDAFLLSTRAGMRARLPGGVSSVYTVRPGGVHEVKVRYDLSGLHRGDQAALVLQNALVVNGQPLPIEPLPFILE